MTSVSVTALTVAALTLHSVSFASAQSFNQAIVFGDSSVDSGFFKALPSPGGGANFNALWAQAVAAGAGAPTTSPGLVNSQILAAYFGLTANPANQPGGTNFATSGAKDSFFNTGPNDGFLAAVPTDTQIANYLAGNGGHANSNGLYLISSGANDVSSTFGPGTVQQFRIQFVQGQADNLAAEVGQLHAAGARTILVPDLAFSFPVGNPDEQQVRQAYSQELWAKLAAEGVPFIPADFNAVRVAIAANPLAFGFTNGVSNAAGQTACSVPAGITSAWALLCSSNPGAPSHFVTANADQTFLFADDQHFTTAGQKIEADYFYSLLVAPSEISLLTLNAVQARAATVSGIQDQIDIARRRPEAGFNVWINGDVASLKLGSAAPGFPGDTSTPLSATVGLDYRTPNGFLVGAAVTTGTQTSSFDLGGNFRENEVGGSLYGAYANGPGWLSVIGSYGTLKYDVNRVVPIGITLQSNTGRTRGADLSVAVQGGYDLVAGNVTHGPVAGLTWQRVSADAFTETGSFTSLAFADQVRSSAITSLGYKASLDLGRVRPFAQVAWNHELGALGSVTAALTTIAAPSYTMDAALPGRDWLTATIGATMNLGGGLTGLASFTAQSGSGGTNTYGGRVGLNYAIGATDVAQAHAQADPAAQPAVSQPPWAPWTVTSSGEVRVYSWRNNLTAPGAPAGSQSRGSEVYAPYGVQLNGTVSDNFAVEIVGRGGWINANNRTPGMSGEIGTSADTTLSGTVTYTGATAIQPFVAVQTNLPTGTSALLGSAANARMDPDLVEIASFGEGLNVGGTVGFNLLLSSEWILTTSVGYTERGLFDREAAPPPLAFDPAAPPPPTFSSLKPGDNFTLVQAVAYTQGAFSTRLTGTLSMESTTLQDGVEVLRPGNRYVLASDTSYTWTPEIGTTTLSASATHSNRNDVLDVPLNTLVKELSDTNSNVFRASLQHLVPIGSFAIGPTGSVLYRDHNGYDSATLQFVPAKQRYSAGVLAHYSPIPEMTFNARVEAVWIHEDANPATDGLKFSPFAGGLVAATALPAISGTAWQTSLGFNYKL